MPTFALVSGKFQQIFDNGGEGGGGSDSPDNRRIKMQAGYQPKLLLRSVGNKSIFVTKKEYRSLMKPITDCGKFWNLRLSRINHLAKV